MKKLTLISLMALLLPLVGCMPQNTPRQAVIDVYHTQEVQMIANFNCYFVVRDTNDAIWFVSVWQGGKDPYNYVIKNSELVFKAKE
jgi:hypothetical protein